jgi:hypothetical protein
MLLLSYRRRNAGNEFNGFWYGFAIGALLFALLFIGYWLFK